MKTIDKMIAGLVLLAFCCATPLHELAGQNDCLPDGIVLRSQEDVDDFPANYPNCSVVLGNVVIFESNGEEINNLHGLIQIRHIMGSLGVLQSEGLTDLSGLNNLGQVDEDFVIRNMERLQDISSLTKLTNVGGEMRIDYLDSLTSLVGLESLVEVGGDVTLSLLELLTDISALNNLIQVNGSLTLRDLAVLEELDGLQNIRNIEHSLVIDRLPLLANLAKLSGLETVGTDVYLGPINSLVDLHGLQGLDIVPGNLRVNVGASLQNLSGLQNITSVGGDLEVLENNTLLDFTGLTRLEYIGGDFVVENNHGLKDFTGLSVLDEIGTDLSVNFNNDLLNMDGVETLTSVGGSIKIYNNRSLTRLGGLFNVTSIGQYLEILRNVTLTKIDALENIDPASIDGLLIKLNDQLSTCEVPTICGYLAIPGSPTQISDNAVGCNAPEEVEANCPGVLPVVWSGLLTTHVDEKTIALTWQVSSQQGNDYFEIERSVDGVTFFDIGQVDGGDDLNGVVDYAFTDQAPAIGANYYRIRQVDVDGQHSFSNIALGRMTEGEAIRIYPNPVKEFFQLSGLSAPEQTLKIRNVFGQVTYQRQVADGKVNLSDHPPGLYSLELEGHAPIKIIVAGD